LFAYVFPKTASQELPALLALLFASLSFAQDKTVTGKVTDSKDGSPYCPRISAGKRIWYRYDNR
jgi:hypothetical protein